MFDTQVRGAGRLRAQVAEVQSSAEAEKALTYCFLLRPSMDSSIRTSGIHIWMCYEIINACMYIPSPLTTARQGPKNLNWSFIY